MAEENTEARVDPRADPSVRRPAGVAAASALADEIWRQTYQNGEAAAPADSEPPSDPQVAAEPPAEEQAPESSVQAQEQAPDWENRYNSMRGRYDQAAEQNRALMQRLAVLERQAQQAAPAPPTPQQVPPAGAQSSGLTREEIDEYGEDFLNVVAKRARQDFIPEIAQLKQELHGLRSQLGNVGTHIAMDARSRMEADLDHQMPAWRDINMEQDFLDWLQLPDAYSGVNRHALLRQAFERNETPRVQAFFQGFLAESNASRPPNGGQPPAAPQAPQQRADLTQWAAPGRGRPAAPPVQAPADKPFISRSDISRFYDDVRAGRYAGRNDVKTQIEADIMQAQRDGRIL